MKFTYLNFWGYKCESVSDPYYYYDVGTGQRRCYDVCPAGTYLVTGDTFCTPCGDLIDDCL